MGLFAGLLAATLSAGCIPIEGSAAILEVPTARYVIFGEIHGTHEAPELFGDLVCAAAGKGPVLVGLEIARQEQPLLDAYLASNGDPAARAALLKGDFWTSGDGRSSVAMLALIERLRQLYQAKRILGVIAFVDPIGLRNGQEPYEEAMARRWEAGLARYPGARLVALVGNMHAVAGRVGFGGKPGFMAAASFLPRAQAVTLSYADAGGAAYTCEQDGCRAHAFDAPTQPWPRGIHPMRRSAPGTPHWDYLYSSGEPFTAAEPALRAQ